MGIWDQLNTRTLFGSAKATATQVNTQEKDIHLEEKNRSLLADVNLINSSLMRDGRAIPGTCKVINQAYDDGGASSNSFFTPNQGEVWQCYAGSYSSTGGTSRLFLFLKDDVNNEAMEIADESATSGQQNLLDPAHLPILDENMSLVASITVTDSTSENIRIAMVRIR
mgnify:CR=1 FL=1